MNNNINIIIFWFLDLFNHTSGKHILVSAKASILFYFIFYWAGGIIVSLTFFKVMMIISSVILSILWLRNKIREVNIPTKNLVYLNLKWIKLVYIQNMSFAPFIAIFMICRNQELLSNWDDILPLSILSFILLRFIVESDRFISLLCEIDKFVIEVISAWTQGIDTGYLGDMMQIKRSVKVGINISKKEGLFSHMGQGSGSLDGAKINRVGSIFSMSIGAARGMHTSSYNLRQKLPLVSNSISRIIKGGAGNESYNSHSSSERNRNNKGLWGYTTKTVIVKLNYVWTDEFKVHLKEGIIKFLSELDDKNVYSLLPVIKFQDRSNITMCKSIKVTTITNINSLNERLYYEIFTNLTKYGEDTSDELGELIFMSKIWKSSEDFNRPFNQITDVLNKELESKIKKDGGDNRANIISKLGLKFLTEYTEVLINNYGSLVDGSENHYIHKSLPGKIITVKKEEYELYPEDLLTEVVTGTSSIPSYKVEVMEFNHLIQSWIDIPTKNGFVRVYNQKYRIYYEWIDNNKVLFKVKKYTLDYNYINLICKSTEMVQDDNLGALDLETFTVDESGLQQTYAGGWMCDNEKQLFASKDSAENVIILIIDSIFKYLTDNKKKNISIYAHNLGRFDAVELIKGVSVDDRYEVKGIWKREENKLLSLKIIQVKSRKSVTLLDSISFFGFNSLKNTLKSYDIKVTKGIFPYSFVNKDNLNYVGHKPEKKFYSDYLTQAEYDRIPNTNWDLRMETLKYLDSDVEGLYQLMKLVSTFYYDKHSINITKYKTLPSLTMAIFTSGYYNEDFNIKMIKGKIEKEIRSSYFGGAVHVPSNGIVITKGFGYDMNSQYPFAMLSDMPVGNPTLTTETDLSKLFGFTYGLITPPSQKDLKLAIIRTVVNNQVVFPRTPFKRLIFTEEIKEAIKYGYTFEPEYSYVFNRGAGVFKDFVLEHYKDKATATDALKRNTAKLKLNSLYGRFGMKEVESHMRIVNSKELAKINNEFNIETISHISKDKFLLKYTERLPETLRNFMKELEKDIVNESKIKDLIKERGVPSAIQIASAIAGYSSASMFKFLNIPGNPCLYSDTDSVVLKDKLEDIYIGKNIGQMKLEYNINKAIYLGKKVYAVDRTDGEIIKKAVGMNSKQLSMQDYINFIKGIPLTTTNTTFKIDWSNLNIRITKETKTMMKKEDVIHKQSIEQTGLIKSNKRIYLNKTEEIKATKRSYSLIMSNKRINLNKTEETQTTKRFYSKTVIPEKQKEWVYSWKVSENMSTSEIGQSHYTYLMKYINYIKISTIKDLIGLFNKLSTTEKTKINRDTIHVVKLLKNKVNSLKTLKNKADSLHYTEPSKYQSWIRSSASLNLKLNLNAINSLTYMKVSSKTNYLSFRFGVSKLHLSNGWVLLYCMDYDSAVILYMEVIKNNIIIDKDRINKFILNLNFKLKRLKPNDKNNELVKLLENKLNLFDFVKYTNISAPILILLIRLKLYKYLRFLAYLKPEPFPKLTNKVILFTGISPPLSVTSKNSNIKVLAVSYLPQMDLDFRAKIGKCKTEAELNKVCKKFPEDVAMKLVMKLTEDFDISQVNELLEFIPYEISKPNK